MEAQQAGAEALRGRAIEVSNLMTKSLADYKGKKLPNLQKTDSGLEGT